MPFVRHISLPCISGNLVRYEIVANAPLNPSYMENRAARPRHLSLFLHFMYVYDAYALTRVNQFQALHAT